MWITNLRLMQEAEKFWAIQMQTLSSSVWQRKARAITNTLGQDWGTMEEPWRNPATSVPLILHSLINTIHPSLTFLRLQSFKKTREQKKRKIWLQKEAAYGQYSNWWKNQSPRARQVRRTVSHKSLSCSPGFSNHDVAMVWGRFMGWEGDSVQAVACY